MAAGDALRYSDRVRVDYINSPGSRLQFDGADLPYVPRLRVGVEAEANGGGPIRLVPSPLIDTGCTYPLIRLEDWDHVFNDNIVFVNPGRTTDGRQTLAPPIGGGRVSIRWGYTNLRFWAPEGRITEPIRVLARFVMSSHGDRLRESLIGLGGGVFDHFRMEVDIHGENWLVRRQLTPS